MAPSPNLPPLYDKRGLSGHPIASYRELRVEWIASVFPVGKNLPRGQAGEYGEKIPYIRFPAAWGPVPLTQGRSIMRKAIIIWPLHL